MPDNELLACFARRLSMFSDLTGDEAIQHWDIS